MNSVIRSGLGLISAILLFTAQVQAADEPQVVVEKVATELFALANSKNEGKISEDEYFTKTEAVLDKVVAFGYIAKHVMGPDAYKKATPAQQEAFVKVFRTGLVKSYAKGITNYAKSKIEIVGASSNPKKPGVATVEQKVTDKDAAHKLNYTMQLDKKTDQWKLTNVVLNGVNLGTSFQSQFKAAYKKHGNDLDKLIANWLAE
ncbi:MAG: ABC transporter substrate-binding protein [Cellvibrio sp.]|jgi:phospholipid transport system substrate-binding protein|nr:ABC transporter substrate-binding protein [Cellvibrio sp.]